MAEQMGMAIKEARLAAGMTQVQLADTVGILSARDISNIERGLREPSDEELAAIAKATGTDFDSLPLDAMANVAPEDPVEEAAATAMKSEEILELINSADPAVKEAALAVLKGKAQQGVDLIGSILPVISQLLGNNKTVGDLIPVIIGFLGSKDGAAFMETIKSAIGNIAGMLGGIGSGDGEGKGVRKVSDSFLAFTFFYSVAIFVLVIGFHYMQAHEDIKQDL